MRVALTVGPVTQGAVLLVVGLAGVGRGSRPAAGRGEEGEREEGDQGARALKAASLSNAYPSGVLKSGGTSPAMGM